MISYKPLRGLLYFNNIKLAELVDAKILTPNSSVNINKDQGYLTLRTVDRICNFLTGRLGKPIKINEIIEFIPDKKPDDKPAD